jgi:hypothetical protein
MAVVIVATLVLCTSQSGPGDELARRIRHTPTGIDLILVDPGSFLTGSPDSEHRRDGDESQFEAEGPQKDFSFQASAPASVGIPSPLCLPVPIC